MHLTPYDVVICDADLLPSSTSRDLVVVSG
jgi:hypothetical protein